MKFEILAEGNGSKLLLFFNGWAVPSSAVAHLKADADTTVVAASGYTQLEALPAEFAAFPEIRLVAWSTGVWAAGQVCRGYRFVSATAINGTPYPAHDKFGIPVQWFQATWEHLSEENLDRFYRRVCGRGKYYESWRNGFPGKTGVPASATGSPCEVKTARARLSVDCLREELRRIGEQAARLPSGEGAFIWDKAILSADDRIFPFTSMQAYWHSCGCPVTCLAAPHYPFYLWKTWNEVK